MNLNLKKNDILYNNWNGLDSDSRKKFQTGLNWTKKFLSSDRFVGPSDRFVSSTSRQICWAK